MKGVENEIQKTCWNHYICDITFRCYFCWFFSSFATFAVHCSAQCSMFFIRSITSIFSKKLYINYICEFIKFDFYYLYLLNYLILINNNQFPLPDMLLAILTYELLNKDQSAIYAVQVKQALFGMRIVNFTQLIGIINETSQLERQQVAKKYLSMYNTSIANDVLKNIHGNFGTLLSNLFEDPYSIWAELIHDAAIANQTINLALAVLSLDDADIEPVKSYYLQKYNATVDSIFTEEDPSSVLLKKWVENDRTEINSSVEVQKDYEALIIIMTQIQRKDFKHGAELFSLENDKQIRSIIDQSLSGQARIIFTLAYYMMVDQETAAQIVLQQYINYPGILAYIIPALCDRFASLSSDTLQVIGSKLGDTLRAAWK
ncbi:Annexin_9 [Hexamita inflata]|uniref:Annexin 9 n=1 Tax=Hexamita inflata TaxID=28002 RepID=A0AA86UCF0_9EUKA|nr:Annexin 9 [Hexamita inflata]